MSKHIHNSLASRIEHVFGPTKNRGVQTIHTIKGPVNVIDGEQVSNGKYTFKLVSTQAELDACYALRKKGFAKNTDTHAMPTQDSYDKCALHFVVVANATNQIKGSARLIVKEDPRELPCMKATGQHDILPDLQFKNLDQVNEQELADTLSILPMVYENSRVVADIVDENDLDLYEFMCLATTILANPERTENPAYIMAIQTRALTEKCERVGYGIQDKGCDVEHYGSRLPLSFNTQSCLKYLQPKSTFETLKKVWERTVLGQWDPLEGQPYISADEFISGQAYAKIARLLGKGDPDRVQLKDFFTLNIHKPFMKMSKDFNKRLQDASGFEKDIVKYTYEDVMKLAEFNEFSTRFYDRGSSQWLISYAGRDDKFLPSEPPKGRTQAPPEKNGIECALDAMYKYGSCASSENGGRNDFTPKQN